MNFHGFADQQLVYLPEAGKRGAWQSHTGSQSPSVWLKYPLVSPAAWIRVHP
jgi:hypothetical protein